ncbi:MAG: hypothetical protein U5K38_04900 [Woeseiaceae bacterium]|nr:hypothetical protein [Woeseiaceae bacterium]
MHRPGRDRQLRRRCGNPCYRDALKRWRRYETQLQPLAERLEAAGIDIGQRGRTD